MHSISKWPFSAYLTSADGPFPFAPNYPEPSSLSVVDVDGDVNVMLSALFFLS